MWNLIHDTNEQKYDSTEQKRIRDIENGWVVAKEKGSERGMDREFGLSKCKLVHIH